MNDVRLQDAWDTGFHDYKSIVIKKIDSIFIESFRTIKNKELHLGDVMTVVSGKNGTMKSTLLGLIAHPFTSPNDAKDIFGNPLKTKHSDVFYLSPDKDIENYLYYLKVITVDGTAFEEPIRVYRTGNPEEGYRHRVTVGKKNLKGMGNFCLNTSFVNLKRLIPIVDTDAKVVESEMIKSLQEFVSRGYMKILQKDAFVHPVRVIDKLTKQTFGPGEEAVYDYKSISSGEDNIGHILNKMYAFEMHKTENKDALQGIFCIDEFEASLHPVAQIRLFDFIYEWARKNSVQVVINTHSLYLIQYVIELQNRNNDNTNIVLNMISTAYVSNNNYNIIKNPNYKQAYTELTLRDAEGFNDVYKIPIICEDESAERYLKKLISKRDVLKRLCFIHNLSEGKDGNGCQGLKALIKNGEKLLEDSIVFFDSDVNVKEMGKFTNRFLVLPSRFCLPLEKEIVKFIYDLPGNDPFFSENKMERAVFIDQFSKADIVSLEDIEKIRKEKTKKYKNWATGDQRKFGSYVTSYVKRYKAEFKDFIVELERRLNTIFIQKGLPTVSL